MQAMFMFMSKLHVVCMGLCYVVGEGVEGAQTVGLVEHETEIKTCKMTGSSLMFMLLNNMRMIIYILIHSSFLQGLSEI
jgi:hypothetical protein